MRARHFAFVPVFVLAPIFVGCGGSEPQPESLEPDPSSGFGGYVDPGASSPGGFAVDASTPSSAGDSAGAPANDGGCTPDLTGIVRDFKDTHPDFENDDFMSDTGETGIVEAVLGADSKPVYARKDGTGTKLTTGKTWYDQWYRDVSGTNAPIPLKLTLTKSASGVMTYANDEFFPIDGKGFGNQGRDHNFHFTFELHTEFTYQGGEVFTFTGDDDLWVFVNGRLAIDLGGLHPKLSRTIDLDARAKELGLVKGKTHGLSVFHAERHTTASRFRIDTTIEFTNCAPILK